MEAYKNFADVYDLLMEDVPYNEWTEYLMQIFKNHKKSPNLILDLACGTGNMTSKLTEQGFEMIGVDVSYDMLIVAKKKTPNVLFLNQDMRDLDLFGTVDAALCLFDSFNYIHDINQITATFSRVNNFLNPKGIFVFDFNTEYKFKNILSGNSFSKIYDDAVCAFETFYDEETQIIEYYTDFFVKIKDDMYKRFTECHYEKAYSKDEIINAIKNSNLKILDIYDDFSFKKPNDKTERLVFVTQENGK